MRKITDVATDRSAFIIWNIAYILQFFWDVLQKPAALLNRKSNTR